jgi:hypothetical protein
MQTFVQKKKEKEKRNEKRKGKKIKTPNRALQE